MTTEAARIAAALRRQRMPEEEVRAVVAAEDPVLVRRYLELHAERLDEWVREQRAALATFERSLLGARSA
jgi:hypothetical protein